MSLKKLDNYRAIGIDAILNDTALRAEFAYFYFQLTGEKICVGCSGKMRQKFTDLMNINNPKLKDMSERKFILQPDKLIDRTMAPTGLTGQYNASNMTDDIALDLLRSNKGYIKFFKTFPENWEELLGEKTDTVQPETTPEPTEEAPEATESGTEENENIVLEKHSTEYNAKEVIEMLGSFNDIEAIERWTEGEKDLKNKRKTVLKAIRKRLRQLSE